MYVLECGENTLFQKDEVKMLFDPLFYLTLGTVKRPIRRECRDLAGFINLQKDDDLI